VSLQRASWEANSRASREFQRILERQAVREEVVQELLKGNRDIRHRYSEKRAAWQRALAEHGEDVAALAQRLRFPRKEIQRRLREWRTSR
jgi:DNA-binding NtrC family response regulator